MKIHSIFGFDAETTSRAQSREAMFRVSASQSEAGRIDAKKGFRVAFNRGRIAVLLDEERSVRYQCFMIFTPAKHGILSIEDI